MILPEEMECIEFLRKLGPKYANRLALAARLQECPPGTLLFREGHVSGSIYFVLRGTVGLEMETAPSRVVQVQKLGPGELLGWSPVLGLGPMTATARVVDFCRLAVLSVDRLLAMYEDDPRFGMAFLRQVGVVLARRLASARARLTVEQPSPEPQLAG